MAESRFEELTEDFSRHRVPDGKTVSGLRIALIVVGVMITLPAFLTAAEIGHSVGLVKAEIVFLSGGLILAVFGGLIATVAARARLSTYMIIQFSFGVTGAKIVNLIISITLFGWFGVTIYLFGAAVQSALADLLAMDLGTRMHMVWGSALMIATTVFGFKALDKLALVAVPLLIAALIAIVFFALENTGWDQILDTHVDGLSIGTAISAVVGGFTVGVTLFPDLCRYVRNVRHGIIASILSFAVGYPLVMGTSVIPSLATGEKDFLLIMMGLGMGVSAMLILIFATWTTNISNLYSNSLLLATLFRRTRTWKLTLLAGILGTFFATLGIMDNFISFLVLLGIAIPPIAGIYIADFFFIKGQNYDPEILKTAAPISFPAFGAWVFAFGLAYSTANGVFTLTGIPACDSMLASFGLYIVFSKALALFSHPQGAVGSAKTKGSDS